MKKIPMFLLWLGAAISISEIYTGGLIAPLGLARGAVAIVLGHIIGCALLAFGGFISWKQGKNAMQSAGLCFGRNGGRIIALCNAVQLTGWTVVMNVQGASAIANVFPACPFTVAALVLSALVLAWALFFGGRVVKINDILVPVLAALCAFFFIQTFIMSGAVETNIVAAGAGVMQSSMTFTLALELSISMPVSWLPVAGDYTVRADSAVSASLMPFLGYGGGCIAMNLLGLYLGVMTGKDIFAFLPQSRFPVVACAIIVLSTVTTAFLDLYSACLSTMSVVRKTNAAAAGAGLKRGQNQTRLLIIGFVTVALSACFPMNRYGDFLTTFLTAIGSVFTPVYTVLFLDFLANKTGQGLVNLKNGWKLLAAAFGVAGYQVLSRTGFSAPTIAAIALTAFVWLVLVWLEKTLFIRKKEYVSH